MSLIKIQELLVDRRVASQLVGRNCVLIIGEVDSGPTKQLQELAEELEEDAPSVKIAFADVDTEKNVVDALKVTSVPCSIFFLDGFELCRMVGVDVEKISDYINEMESDTFAASHLDSKLKGLSTQSDVVMFMKGGKYNPFCRFSKAATQILMDLGVDYTTFDILTDEDVREGMKTFSDWPTFPQIYVHGEFIGGLDLLKEAVADGSFLESIKKGKK